MIHALSSSHLDFVTEPQLLTIWPITFGLGASFEPATLDIRSEVEATSSIITPGVFLDPSALRSK